MLLIPVPSLAWWFLHFHVALFTICTLLYFGFSVYIHALIRQCMAYELLEVCEA